MLREAVTVNGITDLAINKLDDSFSASAALIDGEIILRGDRSIYCITEKGK